MNSKRFPLGSLVKYSTFNDVVAGDSACSMLTLLYVVVGAYTYDADANVVLCIGDDTLNCNGEMKGYALLSPYGKIETARWRSRSISAIT